MACAAAVKTNRAEKFEAVWGLLEHIKKPENYCVLYDKKCVAENTSGKTKVTVYARIAEAVLPELFALNPSTVCDHVKSKIENLTKIYRKHAKWLQQSGEGVQENKDGSQGSEETLSFYIMGEGPCVETPPHVINIWKEIEKEFPFFPALHHIFASHPNVTPIVITTTLDPQGSKTVWYQPPDDNSNIDPRLLNESGISVAQMPQQEQTFGDDASGLVNANPNPAPQAMNAMKLNVPVKTPGPQHGPKPSSASCNAIENAHKAVLKLPQKCSLADTMLEIQQKNLAAQKAQSQSHINLELHKQIVNKVKIGLWTIEQAQEKIQALEDTQSPHPAKCQKKAIHEFSPDWDEISSGSEDS